MQVICIDNSPDKYSDLTINKIYTLKFEKYHLGIFVINDKGKEVSYKRTRFITLEEWRNRQLNKLLEE